MRALISCAVLAVTFSLNGAEVLHYTLVPGSTITPFYGPNPAGETEPLTGHFAWVQYPTGMLNFYAFDAVSLDFQSPSCTLTLDKSPVNDVGTSIQIDPPASAFEEVVDMTGFAIPVGYLSVITWGTYFGPADKPILLVYTNLGISPIGGGRWQGKAQLIALRDGVPNTAPSFTRGPDLVVWPNSGLQLVPNWATQISRGPNYEFWQSLSFTLVADNRELFAAPPALTADGTLSFTPARNQCGEALVTVTLQDNGGTAFGGRDVSAPQSFRIRVLTPAQLVDELTLGVQAANLPGINTQPLVASLHAARSAFDRAQWSVGIVHLGVFQHQVHVRIGPSDPSLARAWIAQAQDIMDLVASFAGPPRTHRAAPLLPRLPGRIPSR